MAARTVLRIALLLVVCQLASNCVNAGAVSRRALLDGNDPASSEGRRFRLVLDGEDQIALPGQRLQKRSPAEVHLSTNEGKQLDVDTSQNDFVHPIVDFILRIVRSQIIKRGKQQIKIPDIYRRTSMGIGPLGVTVKLNATEGWFRDLSSIRRVGDVNVSRSGNDIIMEFRVGLQPMEFGYDEYVLKVGAVSTSGHISGEVTHSSITVKFSMDVGQRSCSISLLDAKVDLLGDLKLRASGMGPLNGMYSSIMSSIANKYREDAIPKAEAVLKTNIQELFERLRCEDDDFAR